MREEEHGGIQDHKVIQTCRDLRAMILKMGGTVSKCVEKL